jgi:hypothetical protein
MLLLEENHIVYKLVFHGCIKFASKKNPKLKIANQKHDSINQMGIDTYYPWIISNS